MLCLSVTTDSSDGIRLTLPDGTQCWVYVSSIRGNRVRLLFEAPPSVRIDRAEVIRRRQQAAAPGGTP